MPILCIILFMILVGYIGFSIFYYKKEFNEEKGKAYIKINQELDEYKTNKMRQLTTEYELKRTELIDKTNEEIANFNNLVETNEKSKEQILNSKQKEIDLQLDIYKDKTKLQIENEILNEKAKLQQELNQFEIEKENKQNELNQIQQLIEEYNKKQMIINQQILKARELQDNYAFYMLQLTDDDISDMQTIAQFASHFHNKQFLGRAIYETYIKKPYTEMIKRVLKSKEISGIYKITYVKTGEIYIGKSVNIAERWKQHIKTSLGIGTLANSTLHNHMNKNGLWDYTFELLEEVPKEKLTEREKFYIKFFESDKYGFNMQIG